MEKRVCAYMYVCMYVCVCVCVCVCVWLGIPRSVFPPSKMQKAAE